MKLRKLAILAILVLMVVGCSDDSKESLGFSLDLDDLDSNSNVDGRSFGVYFWDFGSSYKNSPDRTFSSDLVIVVPYNKNFKDNIFSEKATLTLTVNDSLYHHDEIGPLEYYEDFCLYFEIDKAIETFANYTLNYICDDCEFTDTATVTFVDNVNYLTFAHEHEPGTIMRFDWGLERDNDYQLLSAQQTSPGWGNDFYCKKVDGSVRNFTFPEEYALHIEANNYFSLTEVSQMMTPKTIGLHVQIYPYNLSAYELDKRSLQQIAKGQFKLMHRVLLQSLEIR